MQMLMDFDLVKQMGTLMETLKETQTLKDFVMVIPMVILMD